ncbi:hypothetical protein K504DRAFT_450879 [Pleomassaria siparia CBS 279.74]|uniref:BTB domain-containing protein n=1 Tax=Pleomassaria siparia CBS 279.74 TaxID=1314801 RepID=A0A6G1JU37_9PLEO|nr:hypothetical protein K504DRAFT_450879 [Pleomassaria siparia CBS 279.74]
MATLKDIRVSRESDPSFVESELVVVLVGTRTCQEMFMVYKTLLCNRSPFFKVALNGNWAESQDRTVILPHDDAEVFELWLHMVYTGRLRTKTTKADHGEEYARLLRVYVLAEKLLDVESKNLVAEAVISKTRENGEYTYPSGSLVSILYDGTSAGDPMRRFLVDCHVQCPKHDCIATDEKNRHPDFMHELVLAYMQRYPERTRPFSIVREESVKTCKPDKYLTKIDKKEEEPKG